MDSSLSMESVGVAAGIAMPEKAGKTGHRMRFIAKCLTIGFSILAIIVGLGLIVSASFVIRDLIKYKEIVGGLSTGILELVIVIGIMMIVAAFFGCCGAINENYCSLVIYCIFLLVILMIQVGGIAAGIVSRPEIGKNMGHRMNSTMQRYGEENSPTITQMWNKMQVEFECCGIARPERDWLLLGKQTPSSCCRNMKMCVRTVPQAALYKTGCLWIVRHRYRLELLMATLILLLLVFLQLINIVFACIYTTSLIEA